jgi:tetratricopeptide (TPR) repeat protein
MKQYFYILTLAIFSCNFLISQNQKQKQPLVKYDAPIDIMPSLNYNINIRDSTSISPESLTKIKNVLTLLEKHEDPQALNTLNTFNEKDLEKNELFFLKGCLEMQSEDYINSSSSFSKYLVQVSNDSIKSSLHFILGILDIKKEYFLSAYSNFTKSYELNPKNYYSTISLATMSQGKNDLKNAEFYYRRALEMNPNLNNVWNQLAFICQQTGNNSEAVKIFSKIIKNEPDAAIPYNNRGYSNLKIGHTAEALKDVNKSIKLFPENSYAYRNRSLIYIELKELKKACQDIETAMKLGYKEKYGSDLDLVKVQNCGK